jgi:hypothetical protein
MEERKREIKEIQGAKGKKQGYGRKEQDRKKIK